MRTYDEMLTILYSGECGGRFCSGEPFITKKEYIELKKDMLASVKKFARPDDPLTKNFELFGTLEDKE